MLNSTSSDIAWSVYQLKMLLSLLTSFQQCWLSFISIATDLLYVAKQNEAKWNSIKWNETNQDKWQKDIYWMLWSEIFWKRSKNNGKLCKVYSKLQNLYCEKVSQEMKKSSCFANDRFLKISILWSDAYRPISNRNFILCTLHFFATSVGRFVSDFTLAI